MMTKNNSKQNIFKGVSEMIISEHVRQLADGQTDHSL